MIDEMIVAKVNGKAITSQEVDLFLKSLGPEVQRQFGNEEGIVRIYEELINQELMYLQAVEQGYSEEEEFKFQLEMTKESLLKQYAMAKLMNSVKVEDDEIKEYYENHAEHFIVPESITASHILVETEDEAKQIKQKIDSGECFEDMAVEHSLCPSKENGGSLGSFDPSVMVPEFSKAVKELEIGVISEPLRTQFGYHIIRTEERNAAEQKSYEDSKQEIFRMLIAKKQQELYLKTIGELKNEYKVEKFY